MGFSTWELIRSAGITSFLLLFLSVSFGLLVSLKVTNGRMNKLFLGIHQSTGWFSLLFALFHALLLNLDDYQPFTLVEIFIPFMANEHRILNGIGSISLYIMILLFLSADFMKNIGRVVWKWIHGLALPCFVCISIHGILLGADSNEIWGTVLYTSTLSVILSLLVVKLLVHKAKTKKSVTM